MSMVKIRTRLATRNLRVAKSEKLDKLRDEGLKFDRLITELCPDNKQKSISINRLGEAIMFAAASIAYHD